MSWYIVWIHALVHYVQFSWTVPRSYGSFGSHWNISQRFASQHSVFRLAIPSMIRVADHLYELHLFPITAKLCENHSIFHWLKMISSLIPLLASLVSYTIILFLCSVLVSKISQIKSSGKQLGAYAAVWIGGYVLLFVNFQGLFSYLKNWVELSLAADHWFEVFWSLADFLKWFLKYTACQVFFCIGKNGFTSALIGLPLWLFA